MKYVLFILISLMLTACGGSGGPGSNQNSKSLFSSWSGSSGELNLTGMILGSNNVTFEVTPNSGCNCVMDLNGSESLGTATVYSCNHYGPVNYCSSGTTIYNFTNSGVVLSLCDSGSCVEYR